MDFCDRFSQHFVGRGFNSINHAHHYVSGLVGKQRRKNIETIENDVAGSDYQGMEQFISSSPWSHRALMDDIALAADEAIGDNESTGLYIDESSFLKKGKMSAGVSRQWCGRAGKVENCQVGVFACLGRGADISLIDFSLYLPENWAEDPERCERAKIPKEDQICRAKWEQGLDMIRRARANGVRFGWVGADSLYGHNTKFINALEDDGERFVADVRKDFMVWTKEPETALPPRKPNARGFASTIPQLTDPAQKKRDHIRVDELTCLHFEHEARVLEYRNGTKGKLCGNFWSKEVWVWDSHHNNGDPRKRTLIVRQDAAGDFKYTLTNLPATDEGDPLQDYAHKQGERFWIEHAFHEAKSQLGMAQYQVRVWRGWHHHMALTALALLFTTLEKIRTHEDHPLLSCRDITELLDYYLPRRGRSEQEVHAQIAKRHAARQRDIDRRRNQRTGIPPETPI